MITLALVAAFLVLIAVCVPWTYAAVIAWFASALLMEVLAVQHGVLRFGVFPICVAWCLVIFFPDRSPLGPLSREERACHQVVLAVSIGARAAYQANTLDSQRATFVADLEAIDPPNEPWRIVRTAQLLDLRAEPPQVGVGQANLRLVSWPWRVALDHRIVPVRLQLDDVLRARRLRRHPRPGFDDLTTVMRYDYFFLRILVTRIEGLAAREEGLQRWHDEATALLALAGAVSPPNESWTRLRNLILEINEFELQAASTELDPPGRERLAIAADEARRSWATLEQRDTRGLASASEDDPKT